MIVLYLMSALVSFSEVIESNIVIGNVSGNAEYGKQSFNVNSIHQIDWGIEYLYWRD